MHIKQFLSKNKPEDLKEQLGIAVKRHPQYSELILLNYDQIDSPKSDPIVQECRGLIVNENNNYHPVNFALRRFFNHGEGHASEIDWKTARVYDKLDGTLACLWYYDGQWHVSTRGTPDASGNVGGYPFTFKELFWKTWNELGYQLPPEQIMISKTSGEHELAPMNVCFFFELCTMYNKVIVRHEKPKIVLLGSRDLISLEEIEPEFWSQIFKWECVGSHSLGTVDDVLKYASEITPGSAEGYVVVDGKWNRLKIKNAAYIALSSLQEGFGPKRMLEIVMTNESSEFLVHFPEYQHIHDEVHKRFNALALKIDEEYEKIKHIENQKEFALAAQKTSVQSFLFNLRSGKASNAKDAMRNMTVKNLGQFLEIDNIS